jgi:hypothetical protein
MTTGLRRSVAPYRHYATFQGNRTQESVGEAAQADVIPAGDHDRDPPDFHPVADLNIRLASQALPHCRRSWVSRDRYNDLIGARLWEEPSLTMRSNVATRQSGITPRATNAMAQAEGDFEKGESDGAASTLAVVAAAARAWLSSVTAEPHE